MDFAIQLPGYAGPADLLLYLVRREEVEVERLPLARIIEQYLEFLEVLTELNLDEVGDFLEIASHLIEFKAHAVLPMESTPQESSDEPLLEEPSDRLAERLIQYKRFRDVAFLLEEQSQRWQMRFPRLATDSLPVRNDLASQPIAEVEVWDLVNAFGRILKANRAPAAEQTIYDDTPIHQHMQQLHQRIANEGPLELQSLFPVGAHKSRLVAMFLATLELTRHHGVMAIQRQPEGSIWLQRGSDFQSMLEVAQVDNVTLSQFAASNLPVQPR
jgi:segregation and condensation protein A